MTARFQGGSTLRAPYLVGCDGGRSRVRESAGIAFPGEPPSLLLRLGDVRLEVESTGPPGVVLKGGLQAPLGVVLPLGEGWYRVISSEPYPPGFDRDAPMTLDELRESVERSRCP